MTTQTRGRQRIDYSEAEQLLRNGATQQDVADRFGVTQSAINRAIGRGKIKEIVYDRTRSDQTAIPWHPIRPEHRSRYLVRMLRAAARRERGEKSAPVLEAQLDSFLEKAAEYDFVVHYDPDTPEGFWRVPRRPGVDTGLVRNPYLDDDGRTVKNPAGVHPRSEGDKRDGHLR